MTRMRPSNTVVVAWLDRFSRNFGEGVRIQAELTKQNIGIVALMENINIADDSAAAKLFRRMVLAQGAYQVESTSERIKAGLDRARAEGRKPGRPPALTTEPAEECRRMYACQGRRRGRGAPRARAWRLHRRGVGSVRWRDGGHLEVLGLPRGGGAGRVQWAASCYSLMTEQFSICSCN